MSKISRDDIHAIADMMEKKGIPVHVWLPIMHLESSGNVRAHNLRGEDSRGIFQINLHAGPGGRYTPDFVRNLNLFDPIVNARAILSEHWLGNSRRLKEMLTKRDPADQAAYMYQHGIRPMFTRELEEKVRRYATTDLDKLLERYGLEGNVNNEENGNDEENGNNEENGVIGRIRNTLDFLGIPVPDLEIDFRKVLIRSIIIIFGIPVLIIMFILLIFDPADLAGGKMGMILKVARNLVKKEEKGNDEVII